MNNYLLSYNPYNLTVSESQLLNHVQVNRNIAQYYQPFIGTFILKSDQHLMTLSESLRGFFAAAPFFVNQLSPSLSAGSMPEDVWQWLNHGFIPPPPPNTNALSGLFE